MNECRTKELLSYSNLFDKSFQQKVIAQYSVELIIILQDVKFFGKLSKYICQISFVWPWLYGFGYFSLQIREQILFPDLYVLTVESEAYKKKRLQHEKKITKKNYKNFNFILCNFSVWTLQCFQKKKLKQFWPRNSEKIGLKSFTVQPRP